MKRRQFVKTLGTAGLATGALVSGAPAVHAQKTYRWKMVTTWPKNFPGLGTGANYLADIVGKMSGGRLTVKVFGGGELVPPFESFDAVSQGTAEMGHAAAYYWKGKSPAAQFFAAVPFGLNADEMAGWIHYGGGQKLWDDLYADFTSSPSPPATPACRWEDGSTRRSGRWTTTRASRCACRGLAGRSSSGPEPRW